MGFVVYYFQKLSPAVLERVDKVDNALEGQTQSLRQSLVLRTACYARRSPMIPPFRRKPAPQTALPLLTAVFIFKVSLRRHMSAYVTDFIIYNLPQPEDLQSATPEKDQLKDQS